MNKINIGQGLCPTGLSESWDKFPWAGYPGGVEVSFALVQGNTVYLFKLGRWAAVLPTFPLLKDEVLSDALARLARWVEKQGGSFTQTGEGPTVCACDQVGETFRVLIHLSVAKIGPAQVFQPVDRDAILFKGFVGDHMMAPYVAHVLGWPDADKHLPLPRPFLAEAA